MYKIPVHAIANPGYIPKKTTGVNKQAMFPYSSVIFLIHWNTLDEIQYFKFETPETVIKISEN